MKILFVRINDKIGDSVIETFFYRELKKLYPKAQVTVMCCGNKSILQNVPYIDDFIFLPPSGLYKFLVAFWQLPFIWKKKYDLLISFTPHWRMKIFNQCIYAKSKKCFDLLAGQPAAAAYEQVLRQLGLKQIETRYELNLPVAAIQRAKTFLQHHIDGKLFVFFNPRGGSGSRTLSPSRVSEIVNNYSGMPVVLCDYKKEYPDLPAQVIRWHSADILQTAALITQAAYVLTVDTGLAHIADVFGKPMTVLFSLKNYENEPEKNLSLLSTWGPRGMKTKKLWALKSVNDISVTSIINTLPLK